MTLSGMNEQDNRYISLIQNLSDDDAILQLSDDTFHSFVRKVSRLKWATSPEYRQLRNRIILKTDFPQQILSAPTDRALRVLGKISESAQARQHLVTLGLVRAIEQVLLRPSAFLCLWVLNNHLYFMEQVSEQLVAAIVSRLRNTRPYYAWPCLERIALRGMSTKHLFEPVMPDIVGAFKGGVPNSNLKRTIAAIAHATNQSDIMDLVRTMEYTRVTEPVLVTLTISERRSREHLHASSWLRPGESLLMYLSLCSSDNTDVCYIGAENLAIILRAVAPDAFSVPPFESVATRIYAQEATNARAALDFALTGRRASQDDPGRPYGLLTECVLRLANHGDADVRNMGRICLETLPPHILSEVVWSPSLHRFFGTSNNQLVLSMLMLCSRGDLLLPSEIVIANILPMVCTLEIDLY